MDLAYGHPEKVLVVTGNFIRERKAYSVKLVAALLESCRMCQDPAYREDLIAILSKREFTSQPDAILRNSLGGKFFNGVAKTSCPAFHVFHGDSANRPTTDKATWMIAGLRGAGNLPEISCDSLTRLYREDIYMASVAASA